MSVLAMPPQPRGSVGEQLMRQYTYLFQMAQQLNLALDELGTPTALHGGRAAPTAQEKQAYDNLKSLILRTAQTVRTELDTVRTTLEGSYVAQGEFGEYLERLNSSIEADPAAITQYYRFFSQLQANVEKLSEAFSDYRVDTEGYIRTGIVYYDGAVPVYGVAVGQNLRTVEVDGEQVVEQKNFRATYTANKLSFWQDSVEVAYVSDNRLYIRNITALGKVTIGKWDMDGSQGLAFKWLGG